MNASVCKMYNANDISTGLQKKGLKLSQFKKSVRKSLHVMQKETKIDLLWIVQKLKGTKDLQFLLCKDC